MTDKTERRSRIMLTIVILMIMAPALGYIFYTGMVLWGLGLLVVGIVLLALTWLWRPNGK